MSKVIFNLFEPDTIIESLAMYFGIDESVLGDYLLDRYLINRNNMDTIKEAEIWIL